MRARTFAEAAQAIKTGRAFTAPHLGVSGVTLFVLSDARRWLEVADRLAAEIVGAGDRLRERYLANGHGGCERPEDVLYMVTRDGRALAAITRAGELRLNPELTSGRLSFALIRLSPGLRAQAERRAGTAKPQGI